MRKINPNRAVLATFVAALLGGATFAVPYGLAIWDLPKQAVLGFVINLWLGVSLIWYIGILVVAGPCWAILHHLNKRETWHAILLGATLLFLLSLAVHTSGFDGQSPNKHFVVRASTVIWENGQLTQAGWNAAFINSLLPALIGAVLGWVIWFIAYDRAEPTSKA